MVWIHYFIGDTEGNNKWLGQYPGNQEGVKRPYRDCKCTYECLRSTNPICVYVTLADICEGRRQKGQTRTVANNISSQYCGMI